MKILNFLSIFLFTSIILISCNTKNNDDSIALLKKKVESQSQRIDLLENKLINYNYTWFSIGSKYHQIVQIHYYVSINEYQYENNGYKVTGYVANLTSLPMEQVKIIGAIMNKSEKSITKGDNEVSLPSGIKVPFEIFIPTSETNVKEVGIKIVPGRA